MPAPSISPTKAKAESERILRAAGADLNDSLPTLDLASPRDTREIAERALVLNAVIQLSFGAPPATLRSWLEVNGLVLATTSKEVSLLEATRSPSEADSAELRWLIESLWALMWSLSRVQSLSPTEPVGNALAGMFPQIHNNEPAAPFYKSVSVRPYAELFQVCDLYYRAHWYTRDGRLNGYSTGDFNHGIVEFRRRSLEWCSDFSLKWDDIDLST